MLSKNTSSYIYIDRPESEGEAADPTDSGLKKIGVGHREKSAADSVNENDRHGNPNGSDIVVDLEEVADDYTHTWKRVGGGKY